MASRRLGDASDQVDYVIGQAVVEVTTRSNLVAPTSRDHANTTQTGGTGPRDDVGGVSIGLDHIGTDPADRSPHPGHRLESSSNSGSNVEGNRKDLRLEIRGHEIRGILEHEQARLHERAVET
jgi:hypothetical protein